MYSLPIYDSISYRVSHASELINQSIQKEIQYPPLVSVIVLGKRSLPRTTLWWFSPPLSTTPSSRTTSTTAASHSPCTCSIPRCLLRVATPIVPPIPPRIPASPPSSSTRSTPCPSSSSISPPFPPHTGVSSQTRVSKWSSTRRCCSRSATSAC